MGLFGSKKVTCTCILTYQLGLIMPWNTEHGKIALIICEVYTSDRKPFEGDPRNMQLIRVLNDMRREEDIIRHLTVGLSLNSSYSR